MLADMERSGGARAENSRLDRPRRISPEQAAARFEGRSLPAVDRAAAELRRTAALEAAQAEAAKILAEARGSGLDDIRDLLEPQPSEAEVVPPGEMVKGKKYQLNVDGQTLTAKFVRREGEYKDFVFVDDQGREIVRSAVELMETQARAA
jgi:hypothetical protein